MKHIGIFSGSFNPVHIGHLALANWICEYELPDEIWFMVTPHNPLKNSRSLMDDGLRLQMVRLAIEGYPRFKVSDFEFHLPKPSYSINTLNALADTYPGCIFHLIIGADNWARFTQWKDFEELMEKYNLIIYPRKGCPVSIPGRYTNVKAVAAPEMEISSTFIRESYEKGKDVRFFLPEKIRCMFPPKP